MNLSDSIREARRVSVPLVYVTTPDPASCIHKLKLGKALQNLETEPGEKPKPAPIILWDIENGLVDDNPQGKVRLLEAMRKLNQQPATGLPQPEVPLSATKNNSVALRVVKNMPAGVVVFFSVMVPEQFFKEPTIQQQVWNLRDTLKSDGTILIFLGPDIHLPPALSNDILKIDDPYPNLTELEDIVERQYKALKSSNSDVPDLEDDSKKKAALSMQGLAAFPAETAIAMSFRIDGIDYKELREQRISRIERPGLKVWRGGQKLSDLGGLEGIKKECMGILGSKKRRVGAVVFIDEIDKTFAGSGSSDSSGVSTDFLGQMLSFTEDNDIMGGLFLGPPGTGKTQVCKAIGNEAEVLTMAMDINGAKEKWVGSSEQNLREIFKIVLAVSGGVPFLVASCNSADNLPTSLLRRFRVIRAYFDLPTREEKDIIWKIKLAKYELPEQSLPNDFQWSGAEIDMCCEKAWLRDISLIEAAESVIAVAKAKPAELQALREHAHGTYVSAATGKPYDIGSIEQEEVAVKKSRKISLQ